MYHLISVYEAFILATKCIYCRPRVIFRITKISYQQRIDESVFVTEGQCLL